MGKRINHDDVMNAMVYAAQEKKMLSTQAASAMDRMEARFNSAMKFMKGGAAHACDDER